MHYVFTLPLFAHAGEDHQTVAEGSRHLLQEWYVALPLFIVAVALVTALAYVLSRKSKASALLAAAAAMLIGGVALYNVSAVVSVFALGTGLAVTLCSVLASLAKR